MAKVTYDWYATLWELSQGYSPLSTIDQRAYWVVSYECNYTNMTSTIYVEYRIQVYNNSSVGFSGHLNSTAYINGSSIGTKSLLKEVSAGGGYAFGYGGSLTTTIQHDSSGNASFTFQGRGVGDLRTMWTSVQTIPLPNLALSPSVSISGAGSTSSNKVTIGNNISVVLSNTQGRNTTISWPGGSTTKSADGTYSFQIPLSQMSSYTGTSTPVGKVSVSNSIGSSEVDCYMFVSDSYKPVVNTLQFNGTNTNYQQLAGMYVQGLTTPKFSGTLSTSYGATITNSAITISNYSGTGSLSISGNNFTYIATGPFTKSGSHTATANVTDSRGKPSSNKTSSAISVIQYSPPSITPSYVRCDSLGALDEAEGTYIKLTIDYKYYLIRYIGNPSMDINSLVISASGDGSYYDSIVASTSSGRDGDISCTYSVSFILDNGKIQTNDAVYQEGKRYFSYNSGTEKYTHLVEGTDYNLGDSIVGDIYEGLQFALSDSKNVYYKYSDISVTSSAIAVKTAPAYTLISRLHGDAGHGITLGQVATQPGFNVYLDTDFKGNVTKNGQPLESVLNTQSNSQINAYSCNYINNKLIKHCARFTTNTTQTPDANKTITCMWDATDILIPSNNGFFFLMNRWACCGNEKHLVRWTITLWIEGCNKGYAWLTMYVNNFNFTSATRVGSYMIGRTNETWQSVTLSGVCYMGETNSRVIYPQVYYNVADASNKIPAASYGDTCYMVLEIIE